MHLKLWYCHLAKWKPLSVVAAYKYITIGKHWKLKSCSRSRTVSVRGKMGIGVLQTDLWVNMKGWFPAHRAKGSQSSVVEEKKLSWRQTRVWGIYEIFCSVSFLTWGLEATSYPVLEIMLLLVYFCCCQDFGCEYWRWTWTCLNSDYRTVLGTVEKTLQLFQDFRERRKAKMSLCSLYMIHAQDLI